jgi:hypothetical protein
MKIGETSKCASTSKVAIQDASIKDYFEGPRTILHCVIGTRQSKVDIYIKPFQNIL